MNFKNTFILILVVLPVFFFFNSQFLFCGKDILVGLSVDASSHTHTSNKEYKDQHGIKRDD